MVAYFWTGGRGAHFRAACDAHGNRSAEVSLPPLPSFGRRSEAGLALLRCPRPAAVALVAPVRDATRRLDLELGATRVVGGGRGRAEASQGAGRDLIQLGGAPQDRKSTRLNSSHLGISYAVFCLK